jgi:hypothetical protein
MPRRRDPLVEVVKQFEIRNALLAMLTYQRTGVRPEDFDHLVFPDPWHRLVPYAKALVLLRLAQRPAPTPSVVDALGDLISVTKLVHARGA